ncbi:MAG: dicarboxylate/amino acid:cation symporter [Desulfovibrio sp.]
MSKGKRLGLPAQMGIGMALGIVLGMIWQATGLDSSMFKPLGDLFIRLIRMIVVPLVFVSLVSGAAGMGNAAKLGRIAVKTIAYYVATTGVAVALGLLFANFFDPGLGVDIAAGAAQVKKVVPPSIVDTMLNIVPLNPIAAFAEGNLLQIIFFAVMVGFCMSALGDTVKPLLNLFELGNSVMIKMTEKVMGYAPIGVAALIAYTVGSYGLGILLPLIKVILVMYLVCLVHICVTYLPLVVGVARVPLKTFLRVMLEPLLVAFTTCSSAAALPVNIRSVQRLGVPKSISRFTIPLGTTLNMDGAAIYLGIAAVFVSQVYGIPLSINAQVTVLFMAVLASIGSVGVPSMALVVMTMVFTQVGLPMEGIALVAGVDRILDMARTTLNVLGDGTGAVIVSKLENDLAEPEQESVPA